MCIGRDHCHNCEHDLNLLCHIEINDMQAVTALDVLSVLYVITVYCIYDQYIWW
jgi:hypothetical protein